MRDPKNTWGNIILWWGSPEWIFKIVSIGLIVLVGSILAYLLGHIPSWIIPCSLEDDLWLLMLQRIIVFLMVTSFLVAFFCLFCSYILWRGSELDSLIASVKEEETEIRPRIHDSSDEQKQRKEEIIVGNVEENLKGMLKKGE